MGFEQVFLYTEKTHIASGDFGKETFYRVEANGWVKGYSITVSKTGYGTAQADLTESLSEETVPCLALVLPQAPCTNSMNACASSKVCSRAVYMYRPIWGQFIGGISSCIIMTCPYRSMISAWVRA